MQPHEERVVKEKQELDEKISKLEPFIESPPIYSKLPEEEKVRLCQQLDYMAGYSAILRDCIAAFPK